MRKRDQFVPSPPRRPLPWNAVIVAAAVAFLGVAILVAARSQGGTVGTVAGTDFVADESLFADNQARFFAYTTRAGQAARFFVMKSADGVVRAAMDACVVCYKQRLGYRQQGDQMVCNKCGQAFASNRINVVTGGCNPIPLERRVANGQVTVTAAALEAAAVHY
jgi:uncharacterized membrane protein